MKIQDDVEDFMMAANQVVENVLPAYGVAPAQEDLYMDLITEEYEELVEAFQNKDVIETADAICDIMWVLNGLASTLGIPVEACWNEVRDSNRSKVVEGRLIKNHDGKVMKPEGYFKPDLHKVLFT